MKIAHTFKHIPDFGEFNHVDQFLALAWTDIYAYTHI